jgi:hypothetical protein
MRLVWWHCAALLLMLGQTRCWAQVAPDTTGVRPLDKLEAEQERLRRLLEDKPRAYQDKVMDPATLPLDTSADTAVGAAPQGFRSWLLETRVGYTQTQTSGISTRSTLNYGLRGEYRRESFNFGDFSVQTDLRSRTGAFDPGLGVSGNAGHTDGARITLRNTALPISNGIFLNSALGDQISEVTDAFSRSYRLTLGNTAVRGAGLSLRTPESELRAGIGARGTVLGGPYPTFQSAGGNLSWLGYTRRIGEQAFIGGQVDVARGVAAVGSSAAPSDNPTQNVTSYGLSFGSGYGVGGQFGAGADFRWRVMLLGSRDSSSVPGSKDRARGVFLESGYRSGTVRHEFGAYSASPDLKFGDNVLLSDTRGVYWRADQSLARTSRGLGLDYEMVNPSYDRTRPAYRRAVVNINGQHRLDRNSSIGGSLNLRWTTYDEATGGAGTGEKSRAVDGTAYYQTRFGEMAPTRLRLTVRHNQTLVTNGSTASGQELAWEQEWISGRFETLRPELTTTLGWARDESTGQVQHSPTAGLVFRQWLSADQHVAGSLRYTSRTGNLATSRGLSGNITAETLLDRSVNGSLRLGGTIGLNQALSTQSATLFGGSLTTRSNDKTMQVYLRWDGASGRPFETLGGRAAGAAGGGALSGLVFFDTNRDGEQQPGESGVANVEIVLDGRYRIVTDAAGRFELAVVATGDHRLTVNLDSVPLPWGLAPGGDKGVIVAVPLRGRAEVRIPVVRVD